MAFSEEFEMTVNQTMQTDDERKPAIDEAEGADTKKPYFSETAEEESDDKKKFLETVEDNLNDKKERPPRFSTLLGVAPKPDPLPPPPPPPPTFIHEYYPLPPEQRRGVYVSMPILILFVLILFFESTLLFAYTLVGLYNNAPGGLFSWAQTNATTAGCACVNSSPAINFAPNFIMPGASQLATNTLTISPSPGTTAITTTSTVGAAAAISNFLGIVGGLGKSTSTSAPIAIVTITPPQATVTSVKLLTADASGNIITPSMITLTSTQLVSPTTQSTTSTDIISRDEGSWAIISSRIEDAQESLSATITSSASATPGAASATSGIGS